MQTFPVRVDTHLRFALDDLPHGLAMAMSDALMAGQHELPQEEKIWLAAQDFEGLTTVPRGFALKMKKGLAAGGLEVAWDDRRVKAPVDIEMAVQGKTERVYQTKAINRMIEVEQGIYEAPPGAGKTFSTAVFLSKIKQKTIILVNKINIATQWRDEIYSATGYMPGIIGDGQWDEREITIATYQTLWARRAELQEAGWFKRFGCKVLDECHAIGGAVLRELWQMFPAYWGIGLSATPDRHDYLTHVSRAVIGEIFCRTTDEELEEAGVLIKPRVIAIRTPFTFEWEPPSKAHPGKQWQKLTKQLRTDGRRNNCIGEIFGQQRGHCVLVHTDQKMHAKELAGYALAYGWPNDRVFLLTGEQKNDQRIEIIARANEGDCLIISTIGQEAMNIPRLDRFMVVWPTKSTAMLKQMWGRLNRTHVDKPEPPIMIDFYDYLVAPLRKHFGTRRGEYERNNLKVEIV